MTVDRHFRGVATSFPNECNPSVRSCIRMTVDRHFRGVATSFPGGCNPSVRSCIFGELRRATICSGNLSIQNFALLRGEL